MTSHLVSTKGVKGFWNKSLLNHPIKKLINTHIFFPFACLVWQHAACNTSGYYRDYYSRSPQHCNHILYSACESTIMGLIEAWKYFTLILSYIIFHSLMSGQSDLWVRLSVTCQGLTWAGRGGRRSKRSAWSERWVTKEKGSGEDRRRLRGRKGEREREKVGCDFLCDRAP